MAKLPDPTDKLSESDQAVYDKLRGPRSGLSGMYTAMMNHAELADKLGDLGFYMRYRSLMPGSAREMAILAIAKELKADFIWKQHLEPARKAGLPDEIIKELECGNFEQTRMPKEYRELWGVARNVAQQCSIPEERQKYLEKKHGLKTMIELVFVCGFYRMIATVVFSFDVDMSAL